jgi:hypothetical protein
VSLAEALLAIIQGPFTVCPCVVRLDMVVGVLLDCM